MSDYDRVKAWRESKRKSCPGDCGNSIAVYSEFCRGCAALNKRERALNRTIAEVKTENRSKRWTDHVRYFAREMHEFDRCVLCGYSRFVQVCHIRDISSFPDSATIRQVNSVDNVIGLCPNHHWEFDNDAL